MSNKPIAMNKLRSILRLYHSGKSKLYISKTLGVSRNTLKKYIKKYDSLGISYEELKELSELELYQIFCPDKPIATSKKLEELLMFFDYAKGEMTKPGVTKKILWKEYIHKHPEG